MYSIFSGFLVDLVIATRMELKPEVITISFRLFTRFLKQPELRPQEKMSSIRVLMSLVDAVATKNPPNSTCGLQQTAW